MSAKDADGMTNSVDPDQTAPLLKIWVHTVCPALPIQMFRINTVAKLCMLFYIKSDKLKLRAKIHEP